MSEKKKEDKLDLVGIKLALGQICIQLGIICTSLKEAGINLQEIYQSIDTKEQADGHTDTQS